MPSLCASVILSTSFLDLSSKIRSTMHRHLRTSLKCLAAPVAVALHANTINSIPQQTECARFSASTYPANDPSEDRHLMKNTPEWSVAAVFDGHGGWQVSDIVSKTLVESILASLKNVDEKSEIAIDRRITRAFESMEHDIIDRVRPAFNLGFGEVAKVGSCVLLAFKKNDRLIVANCGDCRAILGTSIEQPTADAATVPVAVKKGTKAAEPVVKYVSTRINRDHNARVTLEQLRLEQDHEGEPNLYTCKNPHACYVKGRLQLTRSIGDEYLKTAEFNGTADKHRSGGRYIPDPYTPPYVSHQPDLHHIRLGPRDRFVILATDGLWDYLSDQEAVEIVASCMPASMALPTDTSADASNSVAGGGSAGSVVGAAGAAHYAPAANTTPSSTSNATPGPTAGVMTEAGSVETGLTTTDTTKWELLAAEKLVQRALEIAAQEDGLTLAQLKSLPVGRQRRSRHDDTTAVVMYF